MSKPVAGVLVAVALVAALAWLASRDTSPRVDERLDTASRPAPPGARPPPDPPEAASLEVRGLVTYGGAPVAGARVALHASDGVWIGAPHDDPLVEGDRKSVV